MVYGCIGLPIPELEHPVLLNSCNFQLIQSSRIRTQYLYMCGQEKAAADLPFYLLLQFAGCCF